MVSEYYGSSRAWQFKRPVRLLLGQFHLAYENLVSWVQHEIFQEGFPFYPEQSVVVLTEGTI
jgi:hypothetical protein